MCGIAGICFVEEPQRPVDPDVLRGMTRSLAHRGPDGEGIWSASGVGLGHRRLKILDLSDAAAQPMVSDDGEVAITFNGEIYNFRELRDELAAGGARFQTRGDTEVILRGYEAWGQRIVERLSGIFAFGLWDGRRRSLWLARDPLGVKPLFFSFEAGVIRFGSEIKAILSDPDVERDIDDEALDAFLTFSYTPAPLTGIRGIQQLLPGHVARFDADGCTMRRYWANPYAPAAREASFAEARTQFTELLERVTSAQLVSDVPVGAFLSGGLDSAAIVRAMQRSGARVRALTVGFAESAFDERISARRNAARLGLELEEQEARIDARELLPRIARHLEEPTADSSALAVYLLCRAARERFTVAMSGDGADELLAGYDTYRATATAARYRRLPGWLRRGVVRPLASRLPAGDRKYSLRQVALRFSNGAELGAGRDHCAWRTAFWPELKTRTYSPRFAAAAAEFDPLGRYAAHLAAPPASRERLAQLLNADTEFYLPNDMLVKVDRMSMTHGLEVRVPFLDVEMVRFCANLPADFKLHRGRVRKHILRESLRGDIDDAVLDAPKSGFNVPLERWMRGELGDLLLDAVSTRRHELSRFLQPRAIEQVLAEHRANRADHAHALFAVLMLALWLDNLASAWKPARNPAAQIAGSVA